MQLSLQLSKLQGTTSYFDENVGRVGAKSDTVNRAPELLRSTIGFSEFTTANLQKADAYSFSIIFYKLKTKPNHSTFGNTSLPPSQIISRLIEYDVNAEDTKPFRPRLETLPDDCGDWIKNILRDAWSENPNERPDFKVLTY